MAIVVQVKDPQYIKHGTVVTTCLPTGEYKTSNSGQSPLGGLIITNAGSGYAVGDALVFTIIPDTNIPTNVATAEVISVTGAGGIAAVRITSRGSGYGGAPTVTITSSGGSSGTITAELDFVSNRKRDIEDLDHAAINTRWDSRFDDPTYYSA